MRVPGAENSAAVEVWLGKMGGGTDLLGRQNTCYKKMVSVGLVITSLLRTCTTMVFQKMVLLQLKLHPAWLLTFRPKL